MSPPFTITNESITVVLEGKTYTVKRGDENFLKARDAVLNERWDEVPALVSKGLGIAKWAKGKFTFVDNFMCFQGERLPVELNNRMVEMARKGEDPTFLMKFWERLQKNPSWRSVQQLYGFLTKEGIAMDQDGYLLTYKSVTSDYKDYHTKTFDNRPGVTNKMERNKISDDYDVPCHTGFHVGNLNYAKTFGDTGRKIIICKVDPANVVCVCKTQSEKIRVCEYAVIGHFGAELPNTTFDTKADIGDGEFQGHYDPSVEEFEGDPEDFERADDPESDEVTPEKVNPLKRDADDVQLGPGWAGLARGEIPTNSEVVVRKPTWEGFDALSDDEVSTKSVEDLRKYAGQRLKIVNASKMVKADLVAKILSVRAK